MKALKRLCLPGLLTLLSLSGGCATTSTLNQPAHERKPLVMSGVRLDLASLRNEAAVTEKFGEIIPGADPETFEKIDSFWSRDKDDIYVSAWAIEACHLASFKVMLGSWATDFECAYSGFNKVNGADVATFKALNRQYAKDKSQVYVSFYQVIEKDDIPSMPVAVQRDVEHENLQRIYLVRRVVDADPESFMVFEERYCGANARDRHRCYSGGKAVSCDCEQTR